MTSEENLLLVDGRQARNAPYLQLKTQIQGLVKSILGKVLRMVMRVDLEARLN